jgi:hypothetical protein
MAAPVLLQVIYTGTQIRANFTYEDTKQQDFQIALFQGSSTSPTQTAPSGPLVAVLINPQMNTTSVWSVAIAAVVGGVTGDYSNRIAVIVGPPQNISVIADGSEVVLTWSPPAGATVAYGASVSLFNAATGDLLDNANFTASPGTFRPIGGFNPAISYGVKLAGANTENSYGPYSQLIPDIQAIPAFSALNYTVADGNASLSANSSTSNPDYLLGLYVYAEGSLYASAIAGAPGNLVRLVLQQPLAPEFMYRAYLAYTVAGGGTRGPLSNELPVLVEPATLSAVAYDGTNVSASWNNGVGAPPPTGGYVEIYADSGSVATGNALGTNIVIPSPPLVANTPYKLTVNVQRGASLGRLSAPLAVLTYLAVPTAISYDGKNILVTWDAIGGPDVIGLVIALIEDGAVVQTQPGGNRKALLAAALSPAGTYDIKLQTVGDRTIGPLGAAVPVISVAPRVTGAVYAKSGSTSSVAVSWNASELSNGHGVTGYLVQVYENGAPLGNPISVAGAATDHVTVNLQNILDTSKTHTVAVQAAGTKSTGPMGQASPILTASPAFVSVSYDGAKVTARWTPVGQEGVSGYQVIIGGTTQTTSLTSITFPFTPTGDNPLLSVTVLGATAIGPAATITLLTAIASVSSTRYDGALLTVGWSAATPSPAYLVEVLEGADTVAMQRSTALEATLPVALPLSAAYSVTVRPASADGIVIGPRSQAAPVLIATPSISGVAYDGANVTGSVTAQGGIPLDSTTLVVSLYANGIAVGNPVAAVNGRFTISASGTAGADLTLRALIHGSKNNVSIWAPLSSPVPVLTTAPVIESALLSNNGSQWTISAAWSLPESGSAAGSFTVALKQAGTTLQSWTVSGISFSQAAPAFDVSKALSLVVTPNGNFGTGPSSAAATFVPASIGPATSVVDGDRLTVTWTDPAGTSFTGHRLRFVQQAGGAWLTIAASEIVSATTAFIQLPSPLIDSDAVYGISIDTATGPAWTEANHINSVIVQMPAIASIAFDSSGSLKIEWSPISGAGRYKVRFNMARSVVLEKNPTTNTLTLLSSELPASGIYDVTVQAFASAANDDVSGPVCLPLPAVVLAPPNVGIAYDGRTARVTWEPIASPAITGYLTTILNGMAPVATAVTIGPAAAIPAAYAPANNYNVIVQALTSAGKGQPSAQAALFQQAWYPSTATNDTAYIRPAAAAGMSSYDIVIYLPNIFTTYVSSKLPGDPPFVFSTAGAPYSYKLTMEAASAVWTFNADPLRGGIATAYKTLLSKLVGLGVTPLGWRMVQDAISRAMPQTFAETLYYGYAFVPGEGYIDLKPGMLLRADFESYQYLGPDQNVSAYVDGFVSSSSAVYEISSYVTSNDQWLNGFDSFLSIVTQSGSTVPTPQSSGATSSGGGGIVDLYYGQFRRPYVRLVYPPEVLGDGTAEARPSSNVAVLAADDYPTLNAATGYLRNAGTLPDGVAVTYLRGRTIISACIRVWLDEQPLVVPVGTSVGNLLENMGRRPPIVIPQSGNPGIPLSGIVVERSMGYAVTDPSGYSVSKPLRIRLDWNQGMAYSATTDWLNLPLLPGDRVITRGNE